MVVLLVTPRPTPVEPPRVYFDDNFRNRLIACVTDPIVARFWRKEFGGVTKGSKQQFKFEIDLRPGSNRKTALSVGFQFGSCGSWSSSLAIRLRPHRSGHAAFPHPALPEGDPRHIRACAQVRVMRGVGRRKRAVRVSNSGQPMRRLFWLRRLRQRSQVRRTSR
jgi:hypothetical protein